MDSTNNAKLNYDEKRSIKRDGKGCCIFPKQQGIKDFIGVILLIL